MRYVIIEIHFVVYYTYPQFLTPFSCYLFLSFTMVPFCRPLLAWPRHAMLSRHKLPVPWRVGCNKPVRSWLVNVHHIFPELVIFNNRPRTETYGRLVPLKLLHTQWEQTTTFPSLLTLPPPLPLPRICALEVSHISKHIWTLPPTLPPLACRILMLLLILQQLWSILIPVPLPTPWLLAWLVSL